MNFGPMQSARATRPTLPLAALLFAVAAPTFSVAETIPCAEKSVSAAAVRSTDDIEAFVQCAYEYALEMGFEEARRAFHEDARWRDGQFYVTVTSTPGLVSFVFPPDPSREGLRWDSRIDGFGTDFFAEALRTVQIVERGWLYYEFTNPADGLTEPKATYVIRIDWDGEEAVIGSGIYRRDLPGTCLPAQVNAASVETAQSMESLKEFVRCAALEAESKGWFGTLLLERGERWRAGSIYVFGLDMDGNQLFSGNPVMVNGDRVAEWGRGAKATFGGRDMAGVADTFGESLIYYRAIHPETGVMSRKAAFVKRVSAQGAPLLIGAGIYLTD